MNKKDALKEMIDGKNVWHPEFTNRNHYYYMTDDCRIMNTEGRGTEWHNQVSHGWELWVKGPVNYSINIWAKGEVAPDTTGCSFIQRILGKDSYCSRPDHGYTEYKITVEEV